jgi:hypothetical protein
MALYTEQAGTLTFAQHGSVNIILKTMILVPIPTFVGVKNLLGTLLILLTALVKEVILNFKMPANQIVFF